MPWQRLCVSLDRLRQRIQRMRPAPGEQVRAPSAIQLDDVSCQLERRTVLSGVSLEIERGQIAGILGPNGAGKTTLLGLVIGLRRASSGSVTVMGERLPVRGGRLRRRIGVVLQETALYEELTTAENLRFAASLYAVRDAKRRIAEVLELLGLSDRSADLVRTLSGGLRRRVAIARALLHEPELLVIDEPTLGVDVEARHAIWSHLRVLRSMGTTILAATNYLDEAQALCDAVAVLRAGELIAYDTPDALVVRAGRVLDVECDATDGEAVAGAIEGIDGVLRIEQTPSGLSVFLNGQVVPDQVARKILAAAPIAGFRIRAADLAEVFRALEKVS
jgi:ABC-2 type transport system ATP-binding protein